MQALKLKAVFGWRWVVGGWRLFRKQPLSFTALLFFFWLLLLCASAVIGWLAQAIVAMVPSLSVDLVAAVGSLLVAMLTPALTVGFLQACRAADSGLPIHPILLFAPFRAGQKTLRRLLALGSIQMLALVLILFTTSGTDERRPDGSAVPAASQPAATSAPSSAKTSADPKVAAPAESKVAAPTEAEQEAIRHEAVERVVQGLAYLPVALLMWYAPMLVAWHDLPPGKALFFSLVAVWRNRSAFVIYGVAWLAIWMTLSIAFALMTVLFGIGGFAAIIAAPLALLMLTCMYCSVYPTYATVFVDPSTVPVKADEAVAS